MFCRTSRDEQHKDGRDEDQRVCCAWEGWKIDSHLCSREAARGPTPKGMMLVTSWVGDQEGCEEAFLVECSIPCISVRKNAAGWDHRSMSEYCQGGGRRQNYRTGKKQGRARWRPDGEKEK